MCCVVYVDDVSMSNVSFAYVYNVRECVCARAYVLHMLKC